MRCDSIGVSSLQGGAASGSLAGLFYDLGVRSGKRKIRLRSEIPRDELAGLDGEECKAKDYY